MANTSKPVGFVYDFRLSDQSPPIMDYAMASNTTLSFGDPVKLVGGLLEPAVSGDTVLGVVVGVYPLHMERFDGESITTGSNDNPALKICIALADVMFRVHDANATPDETARGVAVDIVGSTGVYGIDTSVTINGDFTVADRAWSDNLSGNALEANVDWVGSFAKRVFG